MRPIVTAGAATAGVKGRRSMFVKPIAGLMVCGGIVVRFVPFVIRLWTHCGPKEARTLLWKMARSGRT